MLQRSMFYLYVCILLWMLFYLYCIKFKKQTFRYPTRSKKRRVTRCVHYNTVDIQGIACIGFILCSLNPDPIEYFSISALLFAIKILPGMNDSQ